MTLGTLAYMSPEQLRGETVDTRSDISSFGVVLYEMLAGVHPFRKPEAVETGHAILSETPAPLSESLGQVPLLQHTLRKMLAKEPGRRYQHVGDVRVNLRELLREVEAPMEASPSHPAAGRPGDALHGRDFRAASNSRSSRIPDVPQRRASPGSRVSR